MPDDGKINGVPNIQTTTSDVDTTSTIGDEFIDIDVEPQAVFHRLADDIYKSPKEGVREPLANAITAVKTAERKYNITNPVVEISVKDGDQVKLIIQDNGVGITEEVLRNALSVMGRTTHLQDDDLLGQYGIGFFACYKLVGSDGGFFMATRSRETGEAITGVWRPGGFDMDSEKAFDNPFEETDSYGTRFEFDLSKDISAHNIREWVAEYAEWSRVNVIYNEYDSNWNPRFNEDYGAKQFSDLYAEDIYTLTVETDSFIAHCTPEAESETLLLDTPIERNYDSFDLPWNVDIRFKTEAQVVVSGDYTGKKVVSKNAYQNLPSQIQNEYVRLDRLSSDAVYTPGPTGTRESLKENAKFWGWLYEKFLEEYISLSQNVFEKFKTNSLLDVTTKERNLVLNLLDQDDIATYSPKSLKESLQDRDIDIDDETAEEIIRLRTRLEVVDREASSSGDLVYREMRVWEILQECGRGGEVFMGCQLSTKKVRVAFADNSENMVVRLSSTDQYEAFEENYGWTKLQGITPRTISDYDVPRQIRQLFSSPTQSTSSTSDKLTVYYGDLTRDSPIKRTPQEIEKNLNAEEGLGPKDISILIVFPQTATQNVTDNKSLVNSRIGVASCTAAQLEYLKNVPNVITSTAYFANAEQEEIETLHGTYGITEIDVQDVVFHVLPVETYPIFTDEQIMRRAEQYIQDEITGFGDTKFKYKDKWYVPVTKAKLDRIRPFLEGSHILAGDSSYDLGNRHSLRYDSKIYAYARLPNWEGEKRFNALQNLRTSLSDGAKEVIDMVAEFHT